MGLWSKGVENSKNGLPIKGESKKEGAFNDFFEEDEIEKSSPERSSEEPITPSLIKKIDWEERHFQICLALISRPELTSYHNNTVATKEIAPAKIIKQADKMIEELKKHYEEKNQK